MANKSAMIETTQPSIVRNVYTGDAALYVSQRHSEGLWSA